MSDTFDRIITAESALIDGVFVAASLGIRNGVIAAIGTRELPGSGERIRLSPGTVLLPGLVDTHVHVNEPGRTEWEGFASATRAAAAGGVTTIIDMPLNSIPATVDVAALDTKRAIAARKAIVDVGFWGGAVPASLGRLGELHERGVFGFKCFLAPSGVDEFPHLDAGQLDDALAEVAGLGALLIVHAEDPGVLDAHENAGGIGYSDFVASRPNEAELVAIDRVIDGVRRTGARAHILHLSSAAALPRIAAAKAEGLPITVETCPHYLCFTAEQIPDGATQFKCCPPIRDERNRDLLWQGLLDGVIDVIVSDHSPSTRELKLGHGGDFGLAWGGISGLQLGLPAIWTEARRRCIRLERVLGWMSQAPADLVGLPAKGRIRVGADADLVAFDPDASFTVDVEALFHRNRVSAYEGRQLTGVVRGTWLRGESVDLAPTAVPRGVLLAR
ncbi:allantoinase [Marisediminicola sp. UYEF4]|uniref:allantoinase AllB n=1 Tax=Marisediminicola sp. UYEF4 TaxID=1756384 RepID=UPI003398625F